jgi:hypothetical protein
MDMKRSWMTVRAASVLLVLAGGCSIVAGLNNEYEQESDLPSGGGGGGGGGGGPSCLTVADCSPNTDCSTWACSGGTCIVTVAPDDTPLQAGTVGDCKKNVCKDGKPAVLPDDTDVAADSDPCSIELCNNGVKQSMAAPDGTKCGAMGNLGCVNGLCEGCVMNAANCDPSTDCKEATCPDNTCVYTILEGKVTDDSSPTDCKVQVCDAAGLKTIVGDTTETPQQVANNCKVEVCAMAGTVAQENEANGTKCGDPLGVCYLDSVCENAACVQKTKPVGSKAMDNNKVGDCKSILCDGNGGTMEGPNDTDVPMDPNPNDCVMPACTGGNLNMNAPENKGESCVHPVSLMSGKCCGTSCCAGASGNPSTFCDANNMCCATIVCNGTCCPIGASCYNNACCATANVCNNACCPTKHPCNNTGACCPVNSQCPDGSCCPDGKNCNSGNLCAM